MQIIKSSSTEGSIEHYPKDFIRFLGTAGTRFVMLTQRRATGGIWFSYGGAVGVIDPGPGSLVQICAASPALDITQANTLIVTHRHVDHCTDLNALVEGMTLNSRRVPKGTVIITRDSLTEGDAVLMKYAQRKVERIKVHRDGKRRRLSGIATVESVVHAHHGVQCYGLIFRAKGLPTWGLISDTTYLPFFADRYKKCELLVINTSLPERFSPIDHMALQDVADLLKKMSPRLVLLTHMGRQMLDMDEKDVMRAASTDATKTIPARDGMTIDLGDPSRKMKQAKNK